MKRVLIAGIGNIFHGDDGFGCEVVKELRKSPFSEEVTVIDFSIRSYDLAYALTDGYDATILVDAIPRGAAPGTVCLIEPDLRDLNNLAPASLDAHSMNPVSVLQLAQSLGSVGGTLYLVGCEPARLEDETGEIALSEPVRDAVPRAAGMIRSVVDELLAGVTGKSEPILK